MSTTVSTALAQPGNKLDENSFPYVRYQPQWYLYFYELFGCIANVMETLQPYQVPRPKLLPILGATDKEMREAKAKRNERWIAKQEKVDDQRPAFFAALIRSLGPDALQKVKNDERWKSANLEKDPNILYQIIHDTHATNISGAGLEGKDKFALLTNFMSKEFKMSKEESLGTFKEEFDIRYEELIQAGVTNLPDPPTLALIFLEKLDSHYYKHMYENLINLVSNGVKLMPANLLEAYELARQYQASRVRLSSMASLSTSSSSSSSSASSSHTSSSPSAAGYSTETALVASLVPDSNKRAKVSCTACGRLGHTADTCRAKTICTLCNGVGHDLEHCYELKNFKFYLEEKKITKANKNKNKKATKAKAKAIALLALQNGGVGDGVSAGREVTYDHAFHVYDDSLYDDVLDAFAATSLDSNNTPRFSSVSTLKLLLLDTQSSKCFVQMQSNICFDVKLNPRPYTIGGVQRNGQPVLISHVGTLPEFSRLANEIGVSANVTANVLSYGQLKDCGYKIKEIDDVFYLQVDNGVILEFHRMNLRPFSNGPKYHYACDLSALSQFAMLAETESSEVEQAFTKVQGPTTVAQNRSSFTQKELLGTDNATHLHELLGGISPRQLIQLLEYGISDCNVTATDVRRAVAIAGGPPFEQLMGKWKSRQSSRVPIYHPTLLSQQRVVLALDIVFFDGVEFLFGIFMPLGVRIVKDIKSRARDDVLPVVHLFVQHALQYGFITDNVECDGEKSFECLKYDIDLQESTRVRICAAGDHISQVENAIQFLKERVRCHMVAAPYTYCKKIIILCVSFCTFMLNQVAGANSGSNVPPWTQLTGLRLRQNVHLRAVFGSQVAIFPRSTTNAVAIARTDVYIAGYPLTDGSGVYKLLHLLTWEFVTSSDFKVVPLMDITIREINKKAAQEGRTRPANFLASARALRDSDTNTVYDSPDEEPRSSDDEYEPDAAAAQQMDTNDLLADLPRHRPIFPDHSRPGAAEPFDSELGVPARGAAVTQPHGTSFPQQNLNNFSSPDISPTVSKISGRIIHAPSRFAAFSPDAYYANRVPFSNPGTFIGDNNFRHNELLLAESPDFELPDSHHSYKISVKAALRERYEEAMPVINAELQQMIDKFVFHPVHLCNLSASERKSIIRSSLFLKDKYFSTGEFDKFKARLVADGSHQDKDLYENISSPTAATTSVFIVAAIAAHEGREVRTFDIGGAFLNADITSTGIPVFVSLDKLLSSVLINLDASYAEFQRTDGTLVVQLDKALYGCVESARLWFETLRSILFADGFIQNPYDICILNKTCANGLQLTAVTHVDDIDGTGSTADLDDFYIMLKTALPQTTVTQTVGVVLPFTGMTFDYSVPGQVAVTMKNCINDIVQHCGEVQERKTPCSISLFDIRDQAEEPSVEERKWFRTYVAKVLYLAKRVRPECLTAVAFLATRVLVCDSDDISKLKHLLGYIKATQDRGILLRIGDFVSVHAYIDASYGVHTTTGKSHTGCAIVLGDAALVYAKSGKQKLVTKSSTEAELVALSDEASQALHVRNLIRAQGYDTGPAVLHQDNMSTIALVKRGGPASGRSRHINIRHFWVAERVATGECVVRHLTTENMRANILTKPVQGAQFVQERASLTNWI